MIEPEYKPGDKVVNLAVLARTTGLIIGAITAAYTTWMAKNSVPLSGIALVMGATVGFFVGLLTGRILFPASKGYVITIKAGVSSLRSSLLSTMTSAIIISAILILVVAIIFKSNIFIAMSSGISIGVVIGILLALLASLL